MNITTARQEGFTIIRLAGNLLGGPDASALKSKLHELADAGNTKVVVDLSGVEFMNSSGLAMLIGSLTTMKNTGGDLKIANASEKITTLIKVTKLAGMFHNYSSVEDAIAAFKK